MSFGRKPNLNDDELQTFRDDLVPLWEKGFTADEIAIALGFGKRKVYANLTSDHIYYYRIQFGLPSRMNKHTKGKPRYTVKPEDVPTIDDPKQVKDALDKAFPLTRNKAGRTDTDTLMWRAFVWCLYYSPLRETEITDRLLSELKLNYKLGVITFNLSRKKKIKKDGIKPKLAPFDIPLSFPYVEEELVTYLQRATENARGNLSMKVFPFTRWMGWSRVKKVFPQGYPHYFRFKYITEGASDPNVTLADLKIDTDLSVSMIETYIMKGPRQRQTSVEKRKARMEQMEKDK